MVDSFWTKIIGSATSVKLKSVTDPLFKYAFLLMVTAGASFYFTQVIWLSVVLFSFGGIILLYGLFSFDFFRRTNPDYLRSEEYHLKKQSMEQLGHKGHSIEIKDIANINNPYQLENGREEDL